MAYQNTDRSSYAIQQASFLADEEEKTEPKEDEHRCLAVATPSLASCMLQTNKVLHDYIYVFRYLSHCRRPVGLSKQSS